jgi:hypothetical protein
MKDKKVQGYLSIASLVHLLMLALGGGAATELAKPLVNVKLVIVLVIIVLMLLIYLMRIYTKIFRTSKSKK